jgi:hypothetical protein
LFSPSGKEVYHASGAESVKWDGCHVWEEGMFYLALHDVTATYGNTISIDYNHIDKYAVLRQDVTVVGNGGCSTITFEGNGFRDLYAVDLYTADGDSIHSVDISHDSDAKTAATFDFSGAEQGVYDAMFRFTEEDKHFDNIVTVEEAVDIELATDVSFPSSFLSGTSTTYTIKITNKGNMTAYQVPIYVYIMNKINKNGINHIEFEGFDLPGMFDDVDMGTFSASERKELQALAETIGDAHYFMVFRTIDEDSPNDSVWVRTNYFLTNIAPYETKILKLKLSANESVWAYFTIPDDWNSIANRMIVPSHSSRSYIRRNSLTEKYCCVSTMIECELEVFSTACDFVSPILSMVAPWLGPEAGAVAELSSIAIALKGCETSMKNDKLKAFNNAFCSSEDEIAERLKKSLLASYRSGFSTGTILSCVSAALSALPIPKGVVKECLEYCANCFAGAVIGIDLTGGNTSCEKLKKPIPGCPSSHPSGGSSTSRPPSDPNDIFGYLSDAGSKFMADTVARVHFTIEFENDTAFAQASAHTIVIRDTLDSRYFDLKSFLPTSVKIGKCEEFLDEAVDVKTAGGVTSFLKTIDLRPEIYAIAQVEGEYNQQTGIAKWMFTSLDPMTMEPTDDLMQGILPVNYNGTSGIGEVMFEVGVKPNKADGTQIPNRAGIVFDYEEQILTPTWVNIVDATAPVSHISSVEQVEDSETGTVTIEATDELSGPWRYDVYVQYGSGAWFKAAENVAVGTAATVKLYEGVEHHFYCVATDMAGNVEQKEPETEASLSVGEVTRKGDVNGDGEINAQDASLILQYVARKFGDNQEGFKKKAADANGDGEQSAQDASLILQHAAKKIDLTK